MADSTSQGDFAQPLSLTQQQVTQVTGLAAIKDVLNDGTVVDASSRSKLNLIADSGITLTFNDDSANDRVDVTIKAGISGEIRAFAGSTTPSGWLICDGSAIDRTTYAALFAVVGTTYGTGDGTTTFNLPDARGRSIVGKGSNSVVSTLGNNDGVTEGNRRGTKHRHTPHTHPGTWWKVIAGSNISSGASGNNTSIGTADGGSGVSTDPLDGGAYLVLNWIIKT